MSRSQKAQELRAFANQLMDLASRIADEELVYTEPSNSFNSALQEEFPGIGTDYIHMWDPMYVARWSRDWTLTSIRQRIDPVIRYLRDHEMFGCMRILEESTRDE